MIPKGFKVKKTDKADELYYDNPIHIAEMACEGYEYMRPSDMLWDPNDYIDSCLEAKSAEFKRGLDHLKP